MQTGPDDARPRHDAGRARPLRLESDRLRAELRSLLAELAVLRDEVRAAIVRRDDLLRRRRGG